MTNALALGEKLLSLLDQSARSSTYKPALLLALLDRVQEHSDTGEIPVRALAERVVELYWQQTLAYPTTGGVLRQNQAGGQAVIVAAIVDFRERSAENSRALPEILRRDDDWRRLVERVELTLAEWPIPRLQRPYGPFLFNFDWSWRESGGWSARAYRSSSRSLRLASGVAPSLISLGPLLRPFVTRWWTDKAAQLNPDVEAAQSVLEFEDFLFGRDRVALGRVAEGLLDLQSGSCFYCHNVVGRHREIDHFIPWSHSGDDGLDNLVAACRTCNNEKRATLPGPDHVAAILDRNEMWDGDLGALAGERHWPRDRARSTLIARAAYLCSPDERPLWTRVDGGGRYETVGECRPALARLLQ